MQRDTWRGAPSRRAPAVATGHCSGGSDARTRECARRPMSVAEIHDGLASATGAAVARSSVKGALASHCSGAKARFRRVRFGVYALAAESSEVKWQARRGSRPSTTSSRLLICVACGLEDRPLKMHTSSADQIAARCRTDEPCRPGRELGRLGSGLLWRLTCARAGPQLTPPSLIRTLLASYTRRDLLSARARVTVPHARET